MKNNMRPGAGGGEVLAEITVVLAVVGVFMTFSQMNQECSSGSHLQECQRSDHQQQVVAEPFHVSRGAV